VPIGVPRSSQYWREFLSLIDVEHCLGLCGIADADDLVMLNLSRGHARTAYDENDRSLMHRISPHWVNAFRIRQQMGTLHDTVIALESALDRVTLAVLFLDAEGQVTRVNHGAERLLARGDVIAVQRGKLVARYPLDARALHLAVASAARGVATHSALPAEPAPTVAPLILRDTRGIPAAYVGVHPLASQSLAQADTPRVVVFIRLMAGCNPRSLADAVVELFGLTTAEARLAIAIHATGDLAQAVQQCGITMDAARSRLKIVFDKTGAHGQPALVRLIGDLGSVMGGG
jgi:hypothetical protein